MSFADARIAVKFPFVVVALALLTGLATGLAAHLKLSADLEASAEQGLAALRESRQAALEGQLRSIRQDLRLLASSVLARDALLDFNRYRPELGDDPDKVLRDIYVDDNPHPRGRRLELDHPRDGSRYSIRHSYFHPWFRAFLRERGYHDIFLFNPAGDLIYSVAKQDDFATNFLSGPWAGTALGSLFQAVNIDPEPGLQLFSDFQAYGPAGGAPASFIAAAIYDSNGIYIGVLALQMPGERIDRVMQVSAGMGRTGESYIIGPDLLMRSNSRFAADPTVLRVKVDTEVSWRALAGETGIMVVPGRSGATTVSAYGPLDFMGTRWGVIAEIEQAELLQPLDAATRFMLAAVMFILILAVVVGIRAARGLSRPIVQTTTAMRRLAEGDLDVEVRHTERGDEIGEMARAFGVFKENARKRQLAEAELARKQEQLRLALDYMPGGMFMLDSDGRFVVASKSYLDLFEFPEGVVAEGASVDDMIRYQSRRGDYGPGDAETHIAVMRQRLTSNEGTRYQRELASGRVLELHVAPAPERGAVVVAADITERVRAEAALRASQQALTQKTDMLEAVLSSMDQGIVAFDGDMKLAVWNDAYFRIRDFPAEYAVIGRPFEDFVRFDIARAEFGDDDPDEIFDRVVSTARRAEPHAFERMRPNGRWIEVRGGPFAGVGFVSTYTDITERRRAEQVLLEQKMILEATLENVDQGISMVDGDLNLVAFNTRAGDILGLSKHVAGPGHSLASIFRFNAERGEYGPGDVEQQVEERMVLARQFKPHRFERTRPDGTVIEIRGNPVATGGFVTTYTDITERKRAEEAVRRSEERLLSILRESPVGVALVSVRENKFVFTNSRLAEMFDFEEGELVGRETPEFFYDARERDALIRELRAQGRVYDHEARLKRRDGTSFWGLLTLVTLEHEGEAARLVWIYDITEIKKAEAALAEKEAQLRVAMDYMPGGMCMVDDDLKIVVLNRQILDVLKFPEEYFRVGESVLTARRYQAARGDFGEIDDDTLVANTKELFAGGKSINYERRLHDGRYISIQANPAPAGGSVIVCADITERRRAEEAVAASQRELAEQRQVLESVLENAAQAIGAFDKDFRLVACNARYKQLLKLPDAMTQPGVSLRRLATHVAESGFFGGGDMGEMVESRLRTMTSGEPSSREVETSDGLTWHSATQPRPEGGFVVTYTDLTERKEAERQLAAAFQVISDSIDYASRIQRAMLPPPERLDAVLPEHFVLWEPRDRVGGDIYWAYPWGDGFLVILADCTGHGVPGAFVTLIASGALALARAEIQPGRLSELVQRMHFHVQATLGQDAAGGESDDGLELGAIYIDPTRSRLTFVGARFQAIVFNGHGVQQIAGTKAGLGYRGIPQGQRYELRRVRVTPGTRVYMTTDGLVDQIGGEKRRMFGRKRFVSLLEEVTDLPMTEQRDRIHQALMAYQGEQVRRDDVSMIGFRIDPIEVAGTRAGRRSSANVFP